MVDKNIIQSRFTKLGVVPIDNQHYLYATLDNNLIGIIVDGLPIYLVIAKAVATALLYPIKDIGDAIVYVLVGVVILGCKEFVLHSTLLQIGLYGSLEIFCSVHI